MSTPASPGPRLLAAWQRLSVLPGGGTLFSFGLGLMVPYTGSIRPRVLELQPGRAVVRLRDRRRIRNHLGSIHALAIANLGELAGGLALLTALPPGRKGIVTRLQTEYLKKARGTLQARGEVDSPSFPWGADEIETTVVATVWDEEGDEVARVVAHWRLR
ncbi:MAG: DUF4442 domain-containing protein [Gemmatimonadota bacterium]